MKKREMELLPVLMVPLRRCGSHAIRLRLSLNPDFYAPYPLHIVDVMPFLPLYGDLSNDNNYFQLTVDLIGLQALSLVKWEGVSIDPIKFFEAIKDKPRSIHTIVWEILFSAASKKKARVAMDKSLDNIHYWRELKTIYPKMRFINLVRDPRAQVSSMNRAIIHEFDSSLNAKILMANYTALQELIKTYPDSVLSVRFEDFITDEETVIKKICEFLDLNFTSDMLQISNSMEAKRIAVQSQLWESNSAPPMKQNIDKFKNFLSASEIEKIETITWEVMDRYGYSRQSAAKAVITEKDWQDAQRLSERMRQEAWKKLQIEKPQDYILRKRRAAYIEMCKQNLNNR